MSEPSYQAPDLMLVGDAHVARYRETDGQVGYEWNGVTTLLLSTVGRKTNQPRTSALIFARDGADFLVVASMGGAPQHPAWYLNLRANPEAEVQVKDQRIPVIGRTASEAERSRLWGIVTESWPNYDVYQSRTDRVIPVVVLTPR